MGRVIILSLLLQFAVSSTSAFAAEGAKFYDWLVATSIDEMTDKEQGAIMHSSIQEMISFSPLLVKDGNNIKIIISGSGQAVFADSPLNMIRIDKNKPHTLRVTQDRSIRHNGLLMSKESAPLDKSIIDEFLNGKNVKIRLMLISGFPQPQEITFDISLKGFKGAYTFLTNPASRKATLLKQKKEQEVARKAKAKQRKVADAKRKAKEEKQRVEKEKQKAEQVKEEKRLAEEKKKRKEEEKKKKTLKNVGGVLGNIAIGRMKKKGGSLF